MLYKNSDLNFILTILKNKLYVGGTFLHNDLKGYIIGKKNNLYLFDLKKIIFNINSLRNFINHLQNEKGKILFIGFPENDTQKENYKINIAIKRIAEKKGHIFLTKDYIRGSFSNYHNIISTYKKFSILSFGLKKTRRIGQFFVNFEDIANMGTFPNAVVFFSKPSSPFILKEFKDQGIPVISIVDSTQSIRYVDYPLLGNFRYLNSIYFYIDLFNYLLKKTK